MMPTHPTPETLSPRDYARRALTVLIHETGSATISLSGITMTDLRIDLETRVADVIAEATEALTRDLATLRAELAQVRSDWAQSLGKQQADELVALRAERDQLQKDVCEHELLWDAFDAGQAAALKDEPRQSNPYPPGDSFAVPPEFSAWEDGYDCCINRKLKADLARLSVDADALTQAGARILELEAERDTARAERDRLAQTLHRIRNGAGA